jgi:hypothetical protein
MNFIIYLFIYLSVIELKKKEIHIKHLHSVHPSSACEQAPPVYLSRLVFEIVLLIASQVEILQCGTRLFSSSYLCIIFLKIRCGRAVSQAVPTPTSKCRYGWWTKRNWDKNDNYSNRNLANLHRLIQAYEQIG